MKIEVKRDTTRDLFNAVLQLVKDNGDYEKAEEIMDYVLTEVSDYNKEEDIELSNYEFDLYAAAQFGGSEGIYIDVWLSGKYTEQELKRYNYSTGQAEKEARRSIGTFKTLKTDLDSMKIMGELCGSLVYWGHKYVNQHIDRYTPIKELEHQRRCKNAMNARLQYVTELSANMATEDCKCEPCEGKACRGKQDGCNDGVVRYIMREVGKHCSTSRYSSDKRNVYFTALDNMFSADKDTFADYVSHISKKYPELSAYQAIAYVFVWLCTRVQDFVFGQAENRGECQ